MGAKFKWPVPEEKNKKLKEIMLHIAEVCKKDDDFGATKLNKILFVADFLAFSALGHPITEATYFHLPKGPAPRQLVSAQEELFAEKRARIEDRPFHGRIQKRLIHLKKADTSIFSKEELEIVDESIKATCGLNGTQLSDWTHDLIPWILTEDREDMPYHTVFTMFDKPVGREGLSWGAKELERLKGLGNVSL